jgi:uncharacterized Zn finger protein (UPF0148 family)
MPETTIEPVADWTCARCDVTVTWMPDAERPELPGTWIKEDGELYCLACRRERAGEAALAGIDDAASAERRRQVESRARIEFEMKRRPEREDNRIAKACHTSVKAVKQARVRLGLQSRRPA